METVNLHSVQVEDSSVIDNGMEGQLQTGKAAVENELISKVPGDQTATRSIGERNLSVLGSGQSGSRVVKKRAARGPCSIVITQIAPVAGRLDTLLVILPGVGD